jgi:hypothetical protein
MGHALVGMIPEYIEKRITRPIPTDASVVPDSTAVLSFGDASKARIATLGLNPSRREFAPTPRLALSASSPAAVFGACNSYFLRKPYTQWFDRFNAILKAFDASYYDGSACHLDLVQWATDPTWNRLEGSIKERLIEEDAPFLLNQLRENPGISLLLVNGGGAWKQLGKHLPVENAQVVGRITGFSHHPAQIYSGTLLKRVRVLAWSVNLQSSVGVQKDLWEKELPGRLRAITQF